MQTEEKYDHEIQISRPTEVLIFFLNFIPLTDLLFPHRLIKFEVINIENIVENILATDISIKSLKIAKANAQEHKVSKIKFKNLTTSSDIYFLIS